MRVLLGMVVTLWSRPALPAAGAALPPPVGPATLLALDRDAGRVEAAGSDRWPIVAHSELIVAAGVRPLALLEWQGQAGGRALFGGPSAGKLAADPVALRAWSVRPDAVRGLLGQWPADGALLARLDRIGPGARSVWLLAGANQGIRPGDTWWLRSDGQPIARLDVRLVEAELCFCGVVPLVSELRLRSGQQAMLWPGPGRRVRGQARSAVGFVQLRGNEQLVWVAAPRNVACPPAARLDFYRAGRYLNSGLAEHRDDRFWYVSLPLSGAPVAVGDDAAIRTGADIVRRRFVARVFAGGAEGYLITAGEQDGLARGQTGTAERAGRVLGPVVVRRTQRSYSAVRPAMAGGALELRPGDSVRFGPPDRPAMTIGAVEQVVAERLFLARLAAGRAAPLLRPLAVRSGGRTVAVGVLVAVEQGRALGLVFEWSLTGVVEAGAALVLDAPPAVAGAAPWPR